MAEQQSKLWYLENFNLFESLSKEELKEVAERTTMSKTARNQFIYFPQDPSSTIYFLKEGRVKIGSYSKEGREMIKAILQPGEVFGELGVAGQEKRNDFAQVISDDALICAMTVDYLQELIRSNSSLGLSVTKLIGFRLKKFNRRLESLIFKDARGRIYEFVKTMAEDIGQAVGKEILVKHNLTHQEIANLTATSRQTVTTVLNEMKNKNLIHLERKSFLVRDINKI